MSDTNIPKDLLNITDLSEMIEKLKEKPEIVNTVASALGLGAPTLSEHPTNDDSDKSTPPSAAVEAVSTSVEPAKRGDDHRLALLLALRPYLSSDRQEIIDYIIKFSKIGDLIKKLK